MSQALGMVETRGFVPLVEAVDAMLKTAEVTLVAYEKIGGAYCCATVRGELTAVQAAVEAGVSAGRKVGEVAASHVIPRPHPELAPSLGLDPGRAGT